MHCIFFPHEYCACNGGFQLWGNKWDVDKERGVVENLFITVLRVLKNLQGTEIAIFAKF